MTESQDLEARVETLENELGIDPNPSIVDRVEEAVSNSNNTEEADAEGIAKTQWASAPDLSKSEVNSLREAGLEIRRINSNYVYIQDAE